MMKRTTGVLRIFILKGCSGCRRALELTDWVRSVKPALAVEVIDLALRPKAGSDLVFAVPTYVFNGSPLFYGNPSKRELQAWLDGLS